MLVVDFSVSSTHQMDLLLCLGFESSPGKRMRLGVRTMYESLSMFKRTGEDPEDPSPLSLYSIAFTFENFWR